MFCRLVRFLTRALGAVLGYSAFRQRLESAENALNTLIDEVRKMTTQLAELQAQVKANTDLEASAAQLIIGLAAQISAAANDPAAIQALSDSLKASATALAASVSANTGLVPPPAGSGGTPTP